MAQTKFAPIHHIGESLLQNAGARLRIAALVKADPSVVDAVTYADAVATHTASVNAAVADEVAFRNSLAPLYVDLQNAVTANYFIGGGSGSSSGGSTGSSTITRQIPFSFNAGLPDLKTVAGVAVTRAFTIGQQTPAVVEGESRGFATTAPTGGDATMYVNKNNQVVGTIIFAVGETTASFEFPNEVDFEINDLLTISTDRLNTVGEVFITIKVTDEDVSELSEVTDTANEVGDYVMGLGDIGQVKAAINAAIGNRAISVPFTPDYQTSD